MSVEELLRRHQPAKPVENSAEPEEVEDQGAFGLLRGAKERAIMLELRKKDGSILAIPYALIEQITFSPSDGIKIQACGREITITGLNLNAGPLPRNSLLNGLCRHRILWIWESQLQYPVIDQRAAQIDKIQY